MTLNLERSGHARARRARGADRAHPAPGEHALDLDRRVGLEHPRPIRAAGQRPPLAQLTQGEADRLAGRTDELAEVLLGELDGDDDPGRGDLAEAIGEV